MTFQGWIYLLHNEGEQNFDRWARHTQEEGVRRLEMQYLHNKHKLNSQRVANEGFLGIVDRQCRNTRENNELILNNYRSLVITQTVQNIMENGINLPFRVFGNSVKGLYNFIRSEENRVEFSPMWTDRFESTPPEPALTRVADWSVDGVVQGISDAALHSASVSNPTDFENTAMPNRPNYIGDSIMRQVYKNSHQTRLLTEEEERVLALRHLYERQAQELETDRIVLEEEKRKIGRTRSFLPLLFCQKGSIL